MKQAVYIVCLTRLLDWPIPGFESYQTPLGSLPLHPWTSHCTHCVWVLEKYLESGLIIKYFLKDKDQD